METKQKEFRGYVKDLINMSARYTDCQVNHNQLSATPFNWNQTESTAANNMRKKSESNLGQVYNVQCRLCTELNTVELGNRRFSSQIVKQQSTPPKNSERDSHERNLNKLNVTIRNTTLQNGTVASLLTSTIIRVIQFFRKACCCIIVIG